MESPTIIHFVRHGKARNHSDVYYGRLLGFPLSEVGREQAARAHAVLRAEAIAAFYSSPQLRARETAQIISAAHPNALLSVSELLDEVYSPFDGYPAEEVEKRNWDVYSHGNPGYEQPLDVLQRAKRFMRGVRIGHAGQQVVAVTHGDLIAFTMLWVKGIAATPQNKQALYADNLIVPASITTLTFQTTDPDEIPTLEHKDPAQPTNSLQP